MGISVGKTSYRLEHHDCRETFAASLREAFVQALEGTGFELGGVDIEEVGPALYRSPSAKSPYIVLSMSGHAPYFASGWVELEYRWAQMGKVVDTVIANIDKMVDPGSRRPTAEFDALYHECSKLVAQYMPDYAKFKDHFCNTAFAPLVCMERLKEQLVALRSSTPDGRYEVPLPPNYKWAPYGDMVLSETQRETYNHMTSEICRRLGHGNAGVEPLRDRRHQYVAQSFAIVQEQERRNEGKSRRADDVDSSPSM